MRLIRCNTLKLETFNNDDQVPPFAILSHCWGTVEITFADIMNEPDRPDPESDIGPTDKWEKVWMAAKTAKEVYNLEYIWVDTCCIDKSSSAELTEAINSMWNWYWHADVCIAFLSDVIGMPKLEDVFSFISRWFTRGWTLQELIAPARLDFFDMTWTKIGDRASVSLLWSDEVCNIDRRVLADGGRHRLNEFSAATRLSWASKRATTRGEDRAYSLLGIFGVNMTTLYGEGYERAFLRLQNKIFKQSADQSIFAWQFPSGPAGLGRRRILLGSAKFMEI
ncbi:HET-domain-containing protein [Ascodesmis nigricans]|uniref:HET-domain-containing protein n=1 Tax=Ascodesmis nigricans TaxID=341454 RepID=A0A4S2MM90_9PEZI|nr:HET-domain-containing protein [Ascodesmis nigricans]